MKRTGIGLLTAIVFIITGIAGAADNLPAWQPGYWWSIQTHMDIHVEDPDTGDWADMVIDDNAPQYTCESIETRTLSRGGMLTYDVYRMPFQGTLSGTGVADVNLTDVEIPLELRDGTVSGEVWIDVDTLGTVFSTRFITADLYAYILFSWQKVGEAEVAITEEYEPVRDTVHFPVAVGNTWSEVVTLYTYGRYLIEYDVGSGPEREEGTFDDAVTLDGDFSVVDTEMYNAWECYRIEGVAQAVEGEFLARYAPDVQNTVYQSMMNVTVPEQGLLLRELTQEVTAYELTPDPTPTPSPTPDPSSSGVSLHLNQDVFEIRDIFHLSRTVVNGGPGVAVDEYIILDVYGQYWFWPSWSESGDFQPRFLAADTVYAAETVLTFEWPPVNGAATGLRFWAALLEKNTQRLFGEYDMVEWAYQ